MTLILDRSVKPESKRELHFELPRISTINLSNGLRVLFVKKNNLPIVQMGLMVDAGSRFDEAAKAGTANLLSLLIDEGAGKWDAIALSDELEKIGALFFQFANSDGANLTMLALKENFGKALELFSAVLIDPKLTEEDFEREKKKQTAEVLQSLVRPSYVANVVFEKNIFNGTPYSHPTLGSEETIKKIEHGDVVNFYSKYYRIENATLVVVANFEKNELIEKLERHFGRWKNTTKVAFEKEKLNPVKAKIFLVDRPDAPQSEILLGHLTDKRNSPDYFSKLVFNSIFGGQFSSRLNSNLREAKGYTYGIHSSFIYNKIGGYFNISTSVETKNTIPAIKEILNEAHKIKNGVTEGEVSFAKSYLIKRFPSLFETYGQVAANLSTLALFDLEIDYYNKYIENMKSVSVESVNKVAREKFHAEDLILTVVGDRKVLEKELSALEHFDELVITTP